MNNTRLEHYIDLSTTVNGFIDTINNLIDSKEKNFAWYYYRIIMNFLRYECYKTNRITFKAYVYFINRVDNSINIEYLINNVSYETLI